MVPQDVEYAMFIVGCCLGTVRNDLIVVDRGDADFFEHSWLITEHSESLSRDFDDICSS